jgi:uncharacterized protein (DUF1800 family)
MRKQTKRPLTVSVTLLSAAFAASLAAQAHQTGTAGPANVDDRAVLHVLNRLGFGPTAGDVERVKRLGISAYIEQQLHPERLPDGAMRERLATFQTLNKSTRELSQDYFLPAMMMRRQQKRQQGAADPTRPPDDTTRREMRTPEQMDAQRAERSVLAQLAQQKVLRATYSERQLEEVLVDFWFNHFNVFAGKGVTRLYLTEYERDAIRPHVFGRFRDLLGATAHSPAMLFYLDNWQSASERAEEMERPGRVQGRTMQGFGRTMPGRPRALEAPQNRRPRGLNENYARELLELHTLGVEGGYTQKDVQEVARAFTGWTIDAPRQGGAFRFAPRMHDDGEKVVLGQRIKSGGGQADGEQVLDILAAHPSTARFVATKLARRFISDEPPAALVERASARFRESRGDIREVVRTIVTSPEFFEAGAYRAKVKTPFEFVVSAARVTGTNLTSALPVVLALRELGMPLYGCQPPTGYADRAEAWVNTGALLNRMNFALSLTEGRLGEGIRRRANRPTAAAPAQNSVSLIALALAGDVSATTQATVAKATTATQAGALILGSPEFQKR